MIVTLLTDFGLQDTYVGQMKAAIFDLAPVALVVDLTHAVPPQDVFAGAFLLWSAVETFPIGTVHVAVVDPGVGSPRRAVALQSRRGDVFVGPDNGLLVPALDRLGGLASAVALDRPEFWRLPAASASATFHGRDIFAPVAGHLAAGASVSRVGTPVLAVERHMTLPQPRGSDGEVLHVDRYGNLVTNFASSRVPRAHYHLRVNGQRAPGAPFYAAVEPGQLLALVGSTGLVEISARNASAAELTGARRGTPVTIEIG